MPAVSTILVLLLVPLAARSAPSSPSSEVDVEATTDTLDPSVYIVAANCSSALYVTISPLVRDRAHRLAEVHWDYEQCDEQPFQAVIYEHPPNTPDLESIEGAVVVWSSFLPSLRGRVLSNYSVPIALPANWDRHSPSKARGPKGPKGHDFCFGFRVAVLDQTGRIINTTCLKIQPTWMGDLIENGHDNLALMELMLPGTHNSGCFPRDRDEFDSHMVRYLLTQDLNFWEQLVMGSRYLDMRVGYYPRDMGDQQNDTHPDHGQKFWVNHDMVRVQPLRPLLEDLRYFLDVADSEIVVLDFHRFPVGFGSSEDSPEHDADEPHEQLIKMIKDIFGDMMLPNDRRHAMASVKEIKECGKRVLVSYGDRSHQVKENQVLWKPIPQLWGNQQTLDGLYSYLDKQLEIMVDRKVEWFALMAELTPTMFDILLNMQRSSLRFMADQVNANVTATAREQYWKRFANIVAVDFFEGSDIVQASIEANQFRSVDKADDPWDFAYKTLWKKNRP